MTMMSTATDVTIWDILGPTIGLTAVILVLAGIAYMFYITRR